MAIPRDNPLPSRTPTIRIEDEEQSQDDPEREPSTPEGEISIQALFAQVQALQRENAAMRLTIENQTTNPQRRQAEEPYERPFAPRVDPRVQKPPTFSGKLSEYQNFMMQCILTFTMCPNTYAKEDQKVLFVISLLRDTALTWARPIMEDEKHPLRSDFTSFKEELDNLYLDRNLKYTAEDKIMRLRQTKSAASYSVEFQSLVALLDLNDAAKRLLFYFGLKPEVKDAIATVDRAKTFILLIDQAINIDQRRHQRTLEDKKTVSPSTPTPQPRTPRPSPAPSTGKPTTTGDVKKSTTPAPTQSRGPRGPLTPDEKARRKANNLCMYCGQPGHIATDCPASLKASQYVANLLNSQQASPSTETPPQYGKN